MIKGKKVVFQCNIKYILYYRYFNLYIIIAEIFINGRDLALGESKDWLPKTVYL
jgi:hypothetical protein